MSRITKADIKEGEFFCKWLHRRMMVNNKNVLSAELGPTGSGKSYRDLKKVEIWYRDYLHRDFPTENICFGVASVMKRLTSKELQRGDILIFEEAGAGLGNLDFQQKVSKMFTYVLQSFRSQNIAIFFNLPYLSMLNKQARMLLHYSSESDKIDFKNGFNICKPFFHQVNQVTGKIYRKYPKISINGASRTIQRFGWSMPEQRIVDAYEQKKFKYLNEMQSGFYEQLMREQAKDLAKMDRKELTPRQILVKKLLEEGNNQVKIQELTGIPQQSVSKSKIAIVKKGYTLEIPVIC